MVACSSCGTRTVTQLREDPPGVQLWRCTTCGELRRWCPRCGQGWVVRALVKKTNQSIYLCQECDATWATSNAIGEASWRDFASVMVQLSLSGSSEQWQQIIWIKEVE